MTRIDTTAAVAAVTTLPAAPLTTAAVALGVSPATASRHAAAGTFPVPVIRMGARVIVPTAALRTLLGLGGADTQAGGDAA